MRRNSLEYREAIAERHARLDLLFEKWALNCFEPEGEARTGRARRGLAPDQGRAEEWNPKRPSTFRALPVPEERRGMRRAKTLTPAEFDRMLSVAAQGNSPHSDTVMLLLSYDAGLRIGEIAKLEINTLLTASGELGRNVVVMGGTAKYGKPREVPMTRRLREAMGQLRKAHPEAARVAFSYRCGELKYRSPNAAKRAYKAIGLKAGLTGVTSHSGRRTFGTETARIVNLAGGSLRDVQEWMGHACLNTTAAYLEPSEVAGDVLALRARMNAKRSGNGHTARRRAAK